MAILRLKPSSYGSDMIGATIGIDGIISNPENMYSDADSSDPASIIVNSVLYNRILYVGGFFDNLPVFKDVFSFTVNIKIYAKGLAGSVFLGNVVNDGSNLTITPLGDSVSLQNPHYATLTRTLSVDAIYTFEDLRTMDNVCVCFTQLHDVDTRGSGYLFFYGADIELSCMCYNKVEYGEKTLIDLTSDTVTASDVARGVTFHLPDGSWSVGMQSANTITKEPQRDSLTITFEGLTKEPTMFAVIAQNEVNFLNNSRIILSVVADGTSVYAVSGSRSSPYGIAYITGSNVSWSYSNGTLKVSSDSKSTAGYFEMLTDYVLVYC